MKEQITPKQYAQERGITLRAVNKMIKAKGRLPGIDKIEKFGRFYLLTRERE